MVIGGPSPPRPPFTPNHTPPCPSPPGVGVVRLALGQREKNKAGVRAVGGGGGEGKGGELPRLFKQSFGFSFFQWMRRPMTRAPRRALPRRHKKRGKRHKTTWDAVKTFKSAPWQRPRGTKPRGQFFYPDDGRVVAPATGTVSRSLFFFHRKKGAFFAFSIFFLPLGVSSWGGCIVFFFQGGGLWHFVSVVALLPHPGPASHLIHKGGEV